MNKNNVDRKQQIIDNINYLMASRGETKSSLSDRTGITRSTIYNILDGKVQSVSSSTIQKISNFFGTTCTIVENHNIEEIENKEYKTSIDGNKNPSAIPILSERVIKYALQKTIGELVVTNPLTYFFSHESNLIAVRVEEQLTEQFEKGTVLIIKRFEESKNEQLNIIITKERVLLTQESSIELKDGEVLIGTVIEERFS